MKLEPSRQIFEEYQMSIYMKIIQVGDELFHADGRRRIESEADEGQTWRSSVLNSGNAPINDRN